jgi:aminoglycoside phosphotransferase (APT) family kinase protein
MFSRSVTGLSTEDPALQTLAQVLDPKFMLEVLSQVAGFQFGNTDGLSCRAEVLSHKIGQRCTIRYTLTVPSDSGQPRELARVIGKLYAKRELANRYYRRTEELRIGPFNGSEPLRSPAPIALLQDLGLVLQEYIDAVDLRRALSAEDGNRCLSLAGRWLAKLHAAQPVAGLKTATLQQVVEKVDQWCAYITPCLRPADVERLHRAQEAVHRLAAETPLYEPVMIHKDFYYGNILWDGRRVWVLDFDELSIGDPALDIGHFIAHLETLSYRVAGREDVFAQASARFLGSYKERTSLDFESRLPFFKAYTFLKLAATNVSRQQDQWELETRLLAGFACREVQG